MPFLHRISRTFYHIDKNLDPIFNDRLKKDEALLFVNYFGLKQRAAELLTKKHKNLIIDNAQAFYCRPLPGKDTFYSPRKFFGIPDGAYLITDKFLELQLEQDVSIDRINHLIKRIEYGPEHGYADYVKNEALLSGQPIKKMSNITKAILNGIDYKRVREKREKNFRFVHKNLKDFNLLQIDVETMAAPMVYPLLIEKDGLKEFLIQNKIYVATYWKDVFKWVSEKDFEFKLAKNLVPLPIDQRYGKTNLTKVVKIIKSRL